MPTAYSAYCLKEHRLPDKYNNLGTMARMKPMAGRAYGRHREAQAILSLMVAT